MAETLPRPFGEYLLTAALGEDALGRVYRSLRLSGEKGFVRLRLLESAELSNDAILDTIEENGEIHAFLKNPAITRGVEMDSVEGAPFIAWSEPSGRTLDALVGKLRQLHKRLPVEHALLIVEKVATALDHAYNTTIDGERTLHGLVWPGFVAISDDGEIRLTGFGLAEGVFPSLRKPRFSREIVPYLAPEERDRAEVGKNSDVFSAGSLLLELLTGQPPSPAEPLSALRGAGGAPVPILPEIQTVLKMTLGPAEGRYASSGDLRRELGKLLFSGPYAPSTFNLAYFLNDLFRAEIESETRARSKESGLDPVRVREQTASQPAPPPSLAPAPSPRPWSRRKRRAPLQRTASIVARRRRSPPALVGGLLALAAVAGGVYVVASRRPPRPAAATAPTPFPTPAISPTPLPELMATPSAPTDSMSPAEFQDEVQRRLAVELGKLDRQMKARAVPPPLPTAPAAADALPLEEVPVSAPVEEPTVPPAPPTPEPTVAQPPTAVAVREGQLVPIEEVDTPPRIATLIKPGYPRMARRARIGGIVVLRILVTEKGEPAQVEVLRGARAGLTEAAVQAVKRWTFTPATKAGVPVKTWTTVPIPFEP